MAEVVYLDVCCLKRPFDDAAAAILDAASAGALTVVRSPAHDCENDRNPREDRQATRLWLESAGVRVAVTATVTARARELDRVGIRTARRVAPGVRRGGLRRDRS